LVGASGPQAFTGPSVLLHRANLAPNNPSLDATAHAQLEWRNGQWHLSNRSPNGATFVVVKGEVTLAPGDLLVLGNQVFKFETD
jgi:hypothetical protein